MIDREFTDKDFAKMLVPVHKVQGNDSVLKAFPLLSAHPEFSRVTAPNANLANKVIKYICYAFDRNSPYVIYADSLEDRRMHAAMKAGLITEGQMISTQVEELIRCQHSATNQAIIRYCRLQGSIDWMALSSYETALYTELGKLGGVVVEKDNDKRKEIIDNAEKLRIVIDLLRDKLLSESNDTILHRDLNAILDAPQLNLTPEKYAELYGAHIQK